jgi:hypothetical protein
MNNGRRRETAKMATQRLRVQPWRDPRLLLGLFLILGSTVLGGKLAASGDDTVEYWAVDASVQAGSRANADQLTPTRAKLSDAASQKYIRTDEQFADALDELVWALDMEPGTLLARSALTPETTRSFRQLPLSVSPGSLPADLTTSDRVDVWVGPGPGDADGKATLVLESVRVVKVASDDIGGVDRTVVVGVDAKKVEPAVVAAVASGHVTIVRVS